MNDFEDETHSDITVVLDKSFYTSNRPSDFEMVDEIPIHREGGNPD